MQDQTSLPVSISFVVPAHNEEACLGRTLQAIHESARAIGQLYEIIVVNDASTDATAEIARQNSARMVDVNHRQIAATRNSGARAAKGERLFFIDADTIANPRAVKAGLREMDKGAVGGGAPTWVDMDEKIPLYGRLLLVPALLLPKIAGFSGGAFMFCTRKAFDATGGFSERLYCGEECLFSLALRREGRFAGLLEPVLTSGRRLRKTSGLQLLIGLGRILFSPVKMVTQRAGVEKIWYDSNREDDDVMPSSLKVRISNAILLLLLIVTLTEPVWARLPWSWTPLATPLGKIRFATNFCICHLGLLISIPPAVILFVNLFRQKRWTGLVQSTALIAFFVWNGWGATEAVMRMWTKVYHWLA